MPLRMRCTPADGGGAGVINVSCLSFSPLPRGERGVWRSCGQRTRLIVHWVRTFAPTPDDGAPMGMDKVTETLVTALKQALTEPNEQRLFKSGKLAGLFPGRTGTSA